MFCTLRVKSYRERFFFKSLLACLLKLVGGGDSIDKLQLDLAVFTSDASLAVCFLFSELYE